MMLINSMMMIPSKSWITLARLIFFFLSVIGTEKVLPFPALQGKLRKQNKETCDAEEINQIPCINNTPADG